MKINVNLPSIVIGGLIAKPNCVLKAYRIVKNGILARDLGFSIFTLHTFRVYKVRINGFGTGCIGNN